jgi:hypothetical protein
MAALNDHSHRLGADVNDTYKDSLWYASVQIPREQLHSYSSQRPPCSKQARLLSGCVRNTLARLGIRCVARLPEQIRRLKRKHHIIRRGASGPEWLLAALPAPSSIPATSSSPGRDPTISPRCCPWSPIPPISRNTLTFAFHLCDVQQSLQCCRRFRNGWCVRVEAE